MSILGAPIAARRTFGGFAPAQRLRDQVIGEDELGGVDVLETQQHDILLVRRAVNTDAYGISFNTEENAAEPALPTTRYRELYLHDAAGMALEIGAPRQRPIESRRGNLEPIGSTDRI